LQNLFLLSPEFREKKNIIIFGTGRMGLLALTVMLQEDIYVHAFCDRNPDLWGMKIMNKQVISIDELVKMKNTCSVIIAEENPVSCKKYLEELGMEDIWIDQKMFSIINDCLWSFI
jgi:hypothetical protein